MTVKIFKPAKTAMQSGKAKNRLWQLQVLDDSNQSQDPLVGYHGGSSTKNQVKLQFETKEDAIRELSYSQRFNNFDLLVGNAQIFWGVAESRNVVDVINQFDEVENSDETDKLGQPLIRFGKYTDVGRFEIYYLPYFRERTFPGKDGRQRGPLVVDLDNVNYDQGRGKWAGDFALRYQHQINQFDIGIHVFTGTARAPFLKSNEEGTRLLPIYQKLTQGGVDIQWTWDAWLLKLEFVIADQSDDNFVSSALGKS